MRLWKQAQFSTGRRIAASVGAAGLLLGLVSCGPGAGFYEALNTKVAAGDYKQAYSAVKSNRGSYSKRERLLLYLDLGVTAHYAGLFDESIDHLRKAEALAEKLYTKSLGLGGASFLINDYVLPYRGEDFEQALIHLFMALGYMKLGEMDEAFVETRKLDSKLHAMNLRYPPNKRNVYKEDAFIRFISGLLYEMNGKIEDAQVDYMKAEEAFKDYGRDYGTRMPDFVVENLLSAADGAGFDDRVAQYRRKHPQAKFLPFAEKRKLAEVVVVHYNGRSPVKVQQKFPAVVTQGVVVHIAYPIYRRNPRPPGGARVVVANARSGARQSFDTEVMEDIEAIATRNLENRMLRVQAKAVARLKAQYILIQSQRKAIRKEFGDQAANAYGYTMSILQEMVSRADTRSWQSLPAEIRVGRILVTPGDYEVKAFLPGSSGAKPLGKVSLAAGQKEILLVRSVE